MFRIIPAMLMLIWLWMAGAPAGASEEKKPECFCLRHQASGSVAHFGCESRIVGHGVTPETKCVGPDGKTKVTIRSMDGFKKLDEGAEGCEPCVPEFRCKDKDGDEADCPDYIRNGEEGQHR